MRLLGSIELSQAQVTIAEVPQIGWSGFRAMRLQPDFQTFFRSFAESGPAAT